MMLRQSNLFGFLAIAITPTLFGQTTAAAGQEGAQASPPTTATASTAAVPAPPTPSPWTRGGVDIYLLGDVYGDLNFNHPASGYNQLYNFNDKANSAHLSFTKVSFEKASGILGFRVDAGTGRTVDIISATDDAPRGFRYLEQMYVEFRPPKAHGMQIDFGKFVTSAGAEVIESNSNWNYSRSLLFALAIPYYHFGVRTTIPVTKTFSTGVQVVNGWNSLGTNNGIKTVGLVGNFTLKKGTWSNSYYTGPQQEGPGVANRAYRQVYDSALVLNPNSKTSVYFNFDYGSDKLKFAPRSTWVGFAGAARFQLNNRFAFAPRLEVFDDRNGFASGSAQTLKELTLTGEMKIHEGVLSRLEYRRDMSDQPYYDRGTGLMVAKNQSTVTLGLIAFFGPKK
ncbi:MAG: porin [Acidobacteriota bacterium]|nr:porin [Acidobacteriota bacterium]